VYSIKELSAPDYSDKIPAVVYTAIVLPDSVGVTGTTLAIHPSLK